MRTTTKLGLLLLALILTTACSSVRLEPVDFGWPVEGVLTVSDANSVEETRYGLSFDVAPLAMAEFKDPAALKGEKLRVIRSADGYYFVTAARFKKVYVFAPGERRLKLEKGIEISESGLGDPALNQRAPYVELVDGEVTRLLTRKGLAEGVTLAPAVAPPATPPAPPPAEPTPAPEVAPPPPPEPPPAPPTESN